MYIRIKNDNQKIFVAPLLDLFNVRWGDGKEFLAFKDPTFPFIFDTSDGTWFKEKDEENYVEDYSIYYDLNELSNAFSVGEANDRQKMFIKNLFGEEFISKECMLDRGLVVLYVPDEFNSYIGFLSNFDFKLDKKNHKVKVKFK